MDGQLVPFNESPIAEQQYLVSQLMTSYDMSTPEGKRGVFRARAGRDFNKDDIGEGSFKIEHVVLWPVSREDEKTGEMRQSTKCCLISPEGDRLWIESPWVARSIFQMAETFGKPPWKGGIAVKLVFGPGQKGGNWIALDLAD